ncbi:MAG: DUF3604 domain-containing protein [Candidatus Binatia bacterium]|nr:DUF3604 domain-containing protein [Candidatus Binatia bacterium]
MSSCLPSSATRPSLLSSAVLALAVLCFALPAAAGQGPWERTETRDECLDYDSLRQPYFGDTHVHTALSMDAVVNSTPNYPSDAYDFAKGAALPYTLGNPVATAQLKRPLDYAIATDHGEFLGETQICLDPGHPQYNAPECVLLRADIGQSFNGPLDAASFLAFYFPTNAPTPRFAWCGAGSVDCLAVTSTVWGSIQSDAEAHYDRSDACGFTTFVGYEWSGNPNFNNLHRNVIFRNENVVPLPISYYEEPHAHGLWNALKTQCEDAGTGCDVLAIPHNSNISGGQMFLPQNEDLSPHTAADAALRSRIEPIVEVNQHKADSECHTLFSPNDELCGFEKTNIGSQLPSSSPEQASFVRDALLVGLQEDRRIGVNPMNYGMISATDGHMGMSGLVREDEYYGHVGAFDQTPEQQIIDNSLFHAGTNPGGLGVIWAEENSRDALFAAMDRREVYSTTGSRPIVRFFAGRLPKDICSSGDFAREGYVNGVPMGGEFGRRGPKFAVLATKDPGPSGLPGNDLQRIQVVKGWVDSAGNKHEETFDIGGDPDNGAGVDTATCTTTGTGFDTICATWTDPAFHKEERAFYYARVVENPSCRWSQYLCNTAAVDCNGVVPPEFALCCDGSLPETIQERAVTSPIFYRPETFSKMRAKILKKSIALGDEELRVFAKIVQAHADLDPDANDLTLEIRDAAVVYSVTVPAGTMVKKGTTWLLKDPLGTLGGIKLLKVKIKGNGGATISLKTIGMPLSSIGFDEHMVHVVLTSGNMLLRHRRMWVEMNGGKALGTSR